ncbi:GNAT family N-acetyltransferase [Streptomyces sp. NPDC058734]|uniref:GNAT family N-acetyltransferase n=1 Tax=Streptomyces sp. NPDC058734 TaxID=3346615 RepID=UPI003682FF03
MRFHWGSMEPVMPVPYVPTLGPVHPDSPMADLFDAVVDVAGNGRFLPYDKDRRWSAVKAEHVLAGDVHQDVDQTLIPTLADSGRRTVKVHVYGQRPDSLTASADLARKLAATHGAGTARIVWFLGPDQPEEYAAGVGTRVQLKDFTSPGPEAPPHAEVRPYDDQPDTVRETFAAFAEDMKADGFAFLRGRMRAGTVGPVLTVAHDGAVAGAIGPMETITDAAGRCQLLPQYFGVLPAHRSHGYGRALWRAAMNWGRDNGAMYQLLQTEVAGASDRLCQSEGLASLGYVCTLTL